MMHRWQDDWNAGWNWKARNVENVTTDQLGMSCQEQVAGKDPFSSLLISCSNGNEMKLNE